MSWEKIDFATASPVRKPIAEGEYVFEIINANFDGPYLRVRARVASDGEFKGRNVNFSYPDPETKPWVVEMVARLREALKVAMFPGENIDVYLNRCSGATFSAPITHRSYFPDGVDVNDPTQARVAEQLNIFKVKAAL